jgi:hypothetical protein
MVSSQAFSSFRAKILRPDLLSHASNFQICQLSDMLEDSSFKSRPHSYQCIFTYVHVHWIFCKLSQDPTKESAWTRRPRPCPMSFDLKLRGPKHRRIFSQQRVTDNNPKQVSKRCSSKTNRRICKFIAWTYSNSLEIAEKEKVEYAIIMLQYRWSCIE